MYLKKVKLINHDCLSILMLLYIMLYTVLAYLMLYAALSNVVCLDNASFLPLISANAFCFQALSWFIDTYFVYFKYYFASCMVFLICWFSYFYVYSVFSMKRLCALCINST